MVTLFQELFHLNVTGHLNKQTTQLINKPRCGDPDILPANNIIKNRITSTFKICNLILKLRNKHPKKHNHTEKYIKGIHSNTELLQYTFLG